VKDVTAVMPPFRADDAVKTRRRRISGRRALLRLGPDCASIVQDPAASRANSTNDEIIRDAYPGMPEAGVNKGLVLD
jgi:hypothetical protein